MVFGAGRLEPSCGVVKSDPGVDRRDRPAVPRRVALVVAGGKGLIAVVLGDCPGSTGVGEAHGDQSAQVQCGRPVV